MKQQETIKQMEQSVIKTGLILGVLLASLFYSHETFSQRMKDMDLEQYEILENNYRKAKEETIQVFYHTMKYESWMKLVWDKENISDKGVGFCSFQDVELKMAFLALKDQIFGLVEKKIDSKKLSSKFRITKNKNTKKIRFITESIIIGNYSFQFVRTLDQKSVHVQKKEVSGIWNYECGVPLESTLAFNQMAAITTSPPILSPFEKYKRDLLSAQTLTKQCGS
jgi:hypothetical protein